MDMSAVTVVTLIVCIFLLFMISLAATSAWVAIRDRKDAQPKVDSAPGEADARSTTPKKAA